MKEGAHLHDNMGNETEEASGKEDTASDAIAEGEEKSATGRDGRGEGGGELRGTILSQNISVCEYNWAAKFDLNSLLGPRSDTQSTVGNEGEDNERNEDEKGATFNDTIGISQTCERMPFD